jgi:hypothetical protein
MFCRTGGFRRRHPEQFPAQRELPGALAIAEEAEVPDAMKPIHLLITAIVSRR